MYRVLCTTAGCIEQTLALRVFFFQAQTFLKFGNLGGGISAGPRWGNGTSWCDLGQLSISKIRRPTWLGWAAFCCVHRKSHLLKNKNKISFSQNIAVHRTDKGRELAMSSGAQLHEACVHFIHLDELLYKVYKRPTHTGSAHTSHTHTDTHTRCAHCVLNERVKDGRGLRESFVQPHNPILQLISCENPPRKQHTHLSARYTFSCMRASRIILNLTEVEYL